MSSLSTQEISQTVTESVRNPFELSVEEALSGECLIGHMLFVDDSNLARAMGNFHISKQYMCVGNDLSGKPLLLSISDENDNVTSVTLDEAIKGAKQVKTLPLHSGHKDPEIQKLIKEKAQDVHQQLDGKKAAHYKMSEQKYIQAVAFAVGAAGVAAYANLLGVPADDAFYGAMSNFDNIALALQATAAYYTMSEGKNLMKAGISGASSLLASKVANNESLAKKTQDKIVDFADKHIPSLEGKLQQVEDWGIFGLKGAAKSLREHLYTDKFLADSDRPIMADAVKAVLKKINPIAARELQTYQSNRQLRDMSPSDILHFMQSSQMFGETRTFINRNSFLDREADEVEGVVSLIKDKKEALNNTKPSKHFLTAMSNIRRRKEKHAKVDTNKLNVFNNEKVSVVVSTLSEGHLCQVFETKSGKLLRAIGNEEIETHFDPIDLENESLMEKKLKEKGYLDSEQEVIVEIENINEIRPTM